MKVTMQSLMAGPLGVHQPGSVANLEKDIALDLIARGSAKPVDMATTKQKPKRGGNEPKTGNTAN